MGTQIRASSRNHLHTDQCASRRRRCSRRRRHFYLIGSRRRSCVYMITAQVKATSNYTGLCDTCDSRRFVFFPTIFRSFAETDRGRWIFPLFVLTLSPRAHVYLWHPWASCNSDEAPLLQSLSSPQLHSSSPDAHFVQCAARRPTSAADSTLWNSFALEVTSGGKYVWSAERLLRINKYIYTRIWFPWQKTALRVL